MSTCAAPNCHNAPADKQEHCDFCLIESRKFGGAVHLPQYQPLSKLYPKYYKSVGTMKDIDVYAVHMLFKIDDPSGALQHASKKLLLSGVRTGGKSKFKDIQEARDTLNRWMELHPEAKEEPVIK